MFFLLPPGVGVANGSRTKHAAVLLTSNMFIKLPNKLSMPIVVVHWPIKNRGNPAEVRVKLGEVGCPKCASIEPSSESAIAIAPSIATNSSQPQIKKKSQ